MKFIFSQQSGLYGRNLVQSIDRIAYVPSSEEGIQEYIFAYENEVPDALKEPELYRGAMVSANGSDEVQLRYDGLNEMVILLTLKADDVFRKENAKLVEQNELFRIETRSL